MGRNRRLPLWDISTSPSATVVLSRASDAEDG